MSAHTIHTANFLLSANNFSALLDSSVLAGSWQQHLSKSSLRVYRPSAERQVFLFMMH